MKLTDEEVDEMILDTDVDDALSFEQIVDVPILQIAERVVEVVTSIHGSESQNESLYRSSTCQIIKNSQSPAASCERTGTTQQ